MKKAKTLRCLFICALVLTLCLTGTVLLTYAAAEENAPTTKIAGHNLSIVQNVQIGYYVTETNVPSGAERGVLIFNGPRASYEYGDENFILTDRYTSGTYSIYYLDNLALYQMTDVFYAVSFVRVGDDITYGSLDKYSILEYCHKYENSTATVNGGQATLGQLILAIENMGAVAQQYANYRIDFLATDAVALVKLDGAHFSDGTARQLAKVGGALTFYTDGSLEKTFSDGSDAWSDRGTSVTYTVPANDVTVTATLSDDVCAHARQSVAAVSPTCTESGNIAYRYCEVCDKYFDGETGNHEITGEDTVIPPTGHHGGDEYAVSETEATYLLSGSVLYATDCAACGERLGTRTENTLPIKYRDTPENRLRQVLYNGMMAHASSVDISGFGLNKNEDGLEILRSVIQGLRYSEAGLFGVDGLYEYSSYSSGLMISVNLSYLYGESEWDEVLADYEARVQAIVDSCPSDTSDFEKILYYHDYLAAHYDYDMRAYSSNANERALAVHDAYGLMTQGVGVCQAYTALYAELLSRAGIEVTYAQSGSMNHIWNVVALDGKTYHIDVTWDDPTNTMPGTVKHTYFMCSDTEIQNGQNPHYGWQSTETCDTDRFVTWWGRDVTSGFCALNGTYYGILGLNLVTCQDLAGTYTGVYTFDAWLDYNAPVYYYPSRAFTGLFVYGNQLVFNTMTDIILYQPQNGNQAATFTNLNAPVANGFVYGCVLDGDVLTYAISTSASASDVVSSREIDLGS